MPWGNVVAGILPFNKENCKVMIQHRSYDVDEGNTWSIVGGAVSKVSDPFGVGEIFEDIGVSEEKIQKSAIEEFIEETDYDGDIHNLSKFHEYPKESNDNVKGFQYHSYTTILDKEISPPTVYDNKRFWESKGYKWVDLDKLLQSASVFVKNDSSKFEELIGEKGSQLHPKFAKTLALPLVQKRLEKELNICKLH